MSRPDRTSVAGGLVAVALVVAIAGCGGGGSTPTRSSASTSSAPKQTPSTIASPADPPTPSANGTTTTGTAATTSVATATASPTTDVAAQRLFARSKTAVAAVKTMRITGTETSNGATMKLDLRFGQHNTAGHITQGGYTFDLIFVGEQFYFRAPVAFIRAQYKNKVPPAVKKSEGKYVVSSRKSSVAQPYASLANRNALLSGVYFPHPNLRHGPNRRIDGVVCASLIDPGRGTFYVRADNALPVEIDATGTGGGALTFSRLNQVPEPGPPPPGTAVDSKGNPV